MSFFLPFSLSLFLHPFLFLSLSMISAPHHFTLYTAGNHEMDVPTSFIPGTDSGGECGVTYSQRYIMPAPANTRRSDSPWYQFIVGPIQFIMMSSEHDFRPGSSQYSFLQHALSAVNRKQTPWLVFLGHRPMYVDSSSTGSPYSDQEFSVRS